MKFNFGTVISLVYGLFMAGILTLVWITQVHPFGLVRSDYYEAGEKHQQHIEKVRRTKVLEKLPELSLNQNELEIHFPYQTSATLKLYRPSNIKLDREFEFSKNIFEVNRDELVVGHYKVQIAWKMDGEAYYWENDLFVP